ncbi:MAG: hypothetical protein ACFFDI_25045 [Promethearchaeota archaeon]
MKYEEAREKIAEKILDYISRRIGDDGICLDCRDFFADAHKCEICNEDISGIDFCPKDADNSLDLADALLPQLLTPSQIAAWKAGGILTVTDSDQSSKKWEYHTSA